MGIAGTDALIKILGMGAVIWLIWISLSGGIATAVTFNLGKIQWYVWAIILLIIIMFLKGKKK